MKAERITDEEILSIIRSNGVANITQEDAVVMETDGSLSILKKVEEFRTESSTLSNVKKVPVG